MVNKNRLLDYARLINKIMKNGDYRLNDNDKETIRYIRELIKKNPNFSDLSDKLIDANGDEEKIRIIIDSYDDTIQKEDKESEEEQIASVFNVSTSGIQHLFLNGGKEVFYFYSESLGRDVVLENTKNGKSLTDILSELKNDNEIDSFNDSKDDLVDESLRSNLEVELYSPNEIKNNNDLAMSLNHNELILLNYLIKNADSLDIHLINVENLFYITSDHKIKEITFDRNYKPVVSEPEYEKNVENNNASNEEQDNLRDNNDIDEMFSDQDSNNKDNNLEIELDKSGKQKMLKMDNYQENGFAYNKFFIFVSLFIIIIIIFVFVLFLR